MFEFIQYSLYHSTAFASVYKHIVPVNSECTCECRAKCSEPWPTGSSTRSIDRCSESGIAAINFRTPVCDTRLYGIRIRVSQTHSTEFSIMRKQRRENICQVAHLRMPNSCSRRSVSEENRLSAIRPLYLAISSRLCNKTKLSNVLLNKTREFSNNRK